MCFYYNLSKLAQRYQERAKANEVLRQLDLVNGFTFLEMPVVAESELQLMHWGLVPFWSKDNSIRQYTLNARSETLFEKPSFKHTIQSKRCIIPANGYFEWQHIGKKKQPYFIFLKNQEAFSFAGLWDEWTDKETGEIYRSYAIITTEANPLTAQIHNTKKRMPVILTEDIEMEWLNKGLTKDDITDFFIPIDEGLMHAYPIQPFDRTKKNQPMIINKIHLI